MGTKRTLGISIALVALSSAAGCYKLSSDCALNNNCEPSGEGGAVSTTTPTGGGGHTGGGRHGGGGHAGGGHAGGGHTGGGGNSNDPLGGLDEL